METAQGGQEPHRKWLPRGPCSTLTASSSWGPPEGRWGRAGELQARPGPACCLPRGDRQPPSVPSYALCLSLSSSTQPGPGKAGALPAPTEPVTAPLWSICRHYQTRINSRSAQPSGSRIADLKAVTPSYKGLHSLTCAAPGACPSSTAEASCITC